MGALTLGAIGVVYGDIGTSPLYTVKEVFAPHTGVPLDAHHLIGAVSAIFWALMLVVTLKYVILILRADNHGEGGGLALTALAAQAVKDRPALRHCLLLLGVFGATLFYGDSLITPAISVLGAMEGLELVTPALKSYVVPITVVILVGLFFVQRFGTAVVGRLFGPIIVLWFVVLGATGAIHIAQQPSILAALNPLHAWHFLAERGWHLFAAVGAIVLALTGAEALYADMGHFGRKPIQLAWTGLVLPGLALNYLGQGALLIGDPSALQNPFYRMFPDAFVLPALVLATLAAIIASQAVISGAYSMTKQAVQLGFLPRMTIRYTSAREMGQIYMPAVNWALMLACIALVLEFRESSALAAAYGIAVTGTMAFTTLLFVPVAQRRFGWPVAIAVGLAFLAVDLAFLGANVPKIPHGGAFPLLIGLLLFTVMTTWRRGSELLNKHLNDVTLPLTSFIADVGREKPLRVPGTAVFMSGYPDGLPLALGHHFKHSKSLHERIVLLSIVTEHYPVVPRADRVRVEFLGEGFVRVSARYGFMQTPSIADILRQIATTGVPVTIDQASFFLGRVTVLTGPKPDMARWRKKLFAALHYTAQPAAGYFGIPPGRAVELGMQITI